jgi:hypothetical protein
MKTRNKFGKGQPASLSFAVEHLQIARIFARNAGAPRLVAKIKSALSSADGARRHMERRRLNS